ncbi:hypothetical protein Tco_0377921, partial [Tanacetum coccineum]
MVSWIISGPKILPMESLVVSATNRVSLDPDTSCQNLGRTSNALSIPRRNQLRIGINKWYQSFALRNFDLEVMEFESAQSSTNAKYPYSNLMNKAEIKTMSIDDLYNNFKIVEQKVKKSVSASSGAQNLAFMTAPSTSSTNDVYTAIPAYEVSTASPNVNTTSPQVSTASFSDNVVYNFIVENPNGSNLLHLDLEKIYEDDLDAMDLKWQLFLLSMRAKRECRAPRSKEGRFRNQDNTSKQVNNEDTSSKAMLATDAASRNLRNRSRIGINKWYQSFALRNFNLEVLEFESANSNTTAKLPILKLENGNSWMSVPQTTQENGTSVTKMFVPVTAEEKTNKKNDMKARSLLLMALPNEHQLTFSQYPDAKTMLPLKYDLEKIVSRLAILDVVIAQEDLNLKILSSLPPEWNTHIVVWMNKPEIETMSIDDLYNNFKIVEQKVKKSVGASSGAQNLAFMTAPSTSSTNDANTASPQVSTASFSDNVVYAFMVENPNGSNLPHQDLEQIHEDDMEAMDLKWQLSLLSMRAKRYYPRTGKKNFINANDTAGYDKSKVKCFSCHK